MQLQQNLFSLYRLTLKLPKYLFLSILLFLSIVALSQWISILQSPSPQNMKQTILQYIFAKHNASVVALDHGNGSGYVDNENGEYYLVDERTVVNVERGNQMGYQLDYQYKYDVDNLPLGVMVGNQQLSYLKNRSQQYLHNHHITYDKLILPDQSLPTPFLTYFYSSQMHHNQYLLQSLSSSIIALDQSFAFQILSQNLSSSSKLTIKQLYLTYYYPYNNLIYQSNINLFQYITLQIFNSFILKIVFSCTVIIVGYLMSMFIGLFIRYTLFFAYTCFLVCYHRYQQNFGWVSQNINILGNRFRNNNKCTTVKFIVFYVIANVGIYALLAFGSYCVVKKLLYPLLPMDINYYTDFYFKTTFFVQLFLYLYCRTRTSIRFFPLLSFICSSITLLMITLNPFKNTTLLLNLNFTLQLILFTLFLLIQQAIQNDNKKGLPSEYCPSMSKPRMLFYAGYDISWEKTLPPIWTYFTNWFDYSYFNQSERSLLQKDYQLLYGRMLGLNQRQQIPQYDEQEHQVHEEERRVNNEIRHEDQPSNEMNLIQQNDL